MSECLDSFERLLDLSERMVEAAEGENWSVLTRHEAKRRELVESLPADLCAGLADAEQVKARALLESCQRCDAKVRPLVETHLDELRVLLGGSPRSGSG